MAPLKGGILPPSFIRLKCEGLKASKHTRSSVLRSARISHGNNYKLLAEHRVIFTPTSQGSCENHTVMTV
eukprot:1183062-Prorocentrum_minimum.AAC.5